MNPRNRPDPMADTFPLRSTSERRGRAGSRGGRCDAGLRGHRRGAAL